MTGSGLLARALQHETDHLDGMLYIDTLKGDARRQAMRAVRPQWPARAVPPPLDDHALRVGVAQEVVVRDLPAVGAGVGEHQHVAGPHRRDRLVAGQDVPRVAQLAGRVDRASLTCGRSKGYGQASTGSTVNGWLYPQDAGSRKWCVPPRRTANQRPWVRFTSRTSAAYQPAAAATNRPGSKTRLAPAGRARSLRAAPNAVEVEPAVAGDSRHRSRRRR